MALFRYFNRKRNSQKLPINFDHIFQFSKVRSAIESNNSKKRGQYGKYTPEQNVMIGKRAENGVVANLCIPDRFILVVTSYHSFHFEARGHSSTCARWVWFRPDPTTNFLPQITTNHTIHENVTPPPPPPREIPAIRYDPHCPH